jgi:hypothetical protein
MSVRLLNQRTGQEVDVWNRRIKRKRFKDLGPLRKVISV